MSLGLLIPCLAALTVAVIGCGGYDAEPTTFAQQSILNGQLSNSSDDAVVSLVTKQAAVTQSCTGALVAPNLVLTARHCVADYVDRPFTCNSLGDLVSGPGGQTGAIVEPSNIVVQLGSNPTTDAVDARGATVFAPLTTTVCRNDIALVLLDRPISAIAPLAIRLDRGTQRGELVRVVGYGIFELTRDGFGIRHTKSDRIVTRIGTSQFNPNGDDIPPRSFQLDGGGLCIGDSGGPALSNDGAVVGVFSKFTGDCTVDTTNNYFTETGPYSDEQIRPAFRSAGFDPIPEAGSVLGDAGAATSQSYAGAPSASAAGSGGVVPSTTDTVGGGAGTTYTEFDSGGFAGAMQRPTDVDPLLYDGSPPGGGTCACRAGTDPARGLDYLGVVALALLTKRRRARDICSPVSRDADTVRT